MYFDKHLFFCLNHRINGGNCCANFDAAKLQAYAKDKIRSEIKLKDMRIRVNKAGCLDCCDFGPVVVVYPDGIWYTYLDENDIDEIIESHLVKGLIVDRLLVKS